jgi:hypothetical protein
MRAISTAPAAPAPAFGHASASASGARPAFGSYGGFGGTQADVVTIYDLLRMVLGDKYVPDERKIPILVTGLRWVPADQFGCPGAASGLFVAYTHWSQEAVVLAVPLDAKDKPYKDAEKNVFPIRFSTSLKAAYEGLKFVDLDIWRDSVTLYAATNFAVLMLDRTRFYPSPAAVTATPVAFATAETQLSGQITAMAAMPNGYIAGSTHGQVEIFSDGRLTYCPDFVQAPTTRDKPGTAFTVNCVACSPNGDMVAAGGSNGTVIIWKLDGEGGKIVLTGTIPVTAMAFAPDGCQYLAVAHGYDWAQGAEGMNSAKFAPAVCIRPISEKDFKP